MTNIDYEALGLAAYDAVDDPSVGWEHIARAVVAALRDQGFAVVRARTVSCLVEWIEQTRYHVPASTNVIKSLVDADVALAAQGDGGDAEG